MDGIGLLFFLIPGVIAFAVDFSNGTTYLPEGSRRDRLSQIKFDPKHTTLAQIESIIKDKTGCSVKLAQENIRVSRMHSKEEMMLSFAQTTSNVQTGRLASIQLKKETSNE